MARVYLETSLLSACVSTRADAASVYRRDTSLEWLGSQASLHELYVSAEALSELDNPEYPQRQRALDLAGRFPILAIDEEVIGFASVLIRERVMPGPVAGDAIHVATSCVHRVDYLLSWNVRHLANPSKTTHLQVISVRA